MGSDYGNTYGPTLQSLAYGATKIGIYKIRDRNDKNEKCAF